MYRSARVFHDTIRQLFGSLMVVIKFTPASPGATKPKSELRRHGFDMNVRYITLLVRIGSVFSQLQIYVKPFEMIHFLSTVRRSAYGYIYIVYRNRGIIYKHWLYINIEFSFGTSTHTFIQISSSFFASAYQWLVKCILFTIQNESDGR